ncbi:hypothetical protein L7F22_066825 [Adiantum nelumboides]|nr:hypothetical protein [Adiantum nelumboides]
MSAGASTAIDVVQVKHEKYTASVGSFVLPLYHRDDPNSPLGQVQTSMEKEVSRGGVALRMLQRDRARVEGINKRVGGALKGDSIGATKRDRTCVDDIGGENVVAQVSTDGGEFFTTMRVGYRDFQLVMDTGSDLVWLQCLPCQSCYTQTDPLFDPRASSTFVALNCTSTRCPQRDIMTCRDQVCVYEQTYGDGSFSSGSMARENFYVENAIVHAGLLMGCGHDNEGLFAGAAGLVGLGRGPLSLPSQIWSHTFSYCLSSSGPGSFVLGHLDRADNASDRVYTPLLRNPISDVTYYYIPLTGISIEGQMISSIRASDLTLQQSGRGGVILDSGTVITRLVSSVYTSLRDAFRRAAAARGYRAIIAGYSIFDTCYLRTSSSRGPFPSIELHFQGGSTISLPPQNSMYVIDDESLPFALVCLAFASAGTSDFSILGNVQQEGFLITFDTEASRIGFLSNQCSSSSRS